MLVDLDLREHPSRAIEKTNTQIYIYIYMYILVRKGVLQEVKAKYIYIYIECN